MLMTIQQEVVIFVIDSNEQEKTKCENNRKEKLQV